MLVLRRKCKFARMKWARFHSNYLGKPGFLCFCQAWTGPEMVYVTLEAAAARLTRRKKENFLSRISLPNPDMDSPSHVELPSDSPYDGDAGHMETAQSVGQPRVIPNKPSVTIDELESFFKDAPGTVGSEGVMGIRRGHWTV